MTCCLCSPALVCRWMPVATAVFHYMPEIKINEVRRVLCC